MFAYLSLCHSKTHPIQFTHYVLLITHYVLLIYLLKSREYNNIEIHLNRNIYVRKDG